MRGDEDDNETIDVTDGGKQKSGMKLFKKGFFIILKYY